MTMIDFEQEVLVRKPKARVAIEKPSQKGMISQMFLVLLVHITMVTVIVIGVSYLLFKFFQ